MDGKYHMGCSWQQAQCATALKGLQGPDAPACALTFCHRPGATALQELYGPTAAGRLLNCFSRLFTAYMQWHGFTCGFDDLLLNPHAEAQRAVRVRCRCCS